MKEVGITVEDIEMPAFAMADTTTRGTYLSLRGLAARRGTGTVVKDAGKWGDRAWMQGAALMSRDIARKAGELWWWDGQDLHLATAQNPVRPGAATMAAAPTESGSAA